ncbi:hypothetical protein HGA64_03595, partial [Candidatus Falkowbacteria bacterium]|nr:hypothetical protein [Candidatus Falkowbacteria bacterium]
GWIGQALVARTEATDFTQKTEIAKSKAYEEKTASIKERLKGYIVLAVESKGEAYYITKEGVGVYLKDGNAAFQLMRGQGLGINNKDLDKLKNGDKNIGSRLRGRIVLAVERNGEAYYISPKNLKVYFLKNGQGAFELLRQEGMGINNANLALITKKSADETKSAVKEKNKNEDVAVSSSDGSITLDGQQSGNKVSLNWSLVGFDSSMGFKVVVSKELDPVYPGNEYHYLSDAGTRSDTWELDEPGTYFFRVCEYLGGKCGVYSNNLKVEIE